MVVEEKEGLTNADTTADEEVSRAAATEVNFMVGQQKVSNGAATQVLNGAGLIHPKNS